MSFKYSCMWNPRLPSPSIIFPARHPMKKVRSENYTAGELECLLSLVERFADVINGSKANALWSNTEVNADNVWAIIAKEMAGLGPVIRTAEALKRKKQKWFSAIKAKAGEIAKSHRKTGAGGCSKRLSAVEQRIMALVGMECSTGIPGSVNARTGLEIVIETENAPAEGATAPNEACEEVAVEGSSTQMETDGAPSATAISGEGSQLTLKRRRDRGEEALTAQRETNQLLRKLISKTEETNRLLTSLQQFFGGMSYAVEVPAPCSEVEVEVEPVIKF